VLSFAGAADFQGGAGAQALLGAMGAAGCGVDAAYSRGTERWFTLGCGIVSLAATVHGLIVLGRPNPPLRSQRVTTAFQARPVPWMERGAAGMALAGTF
jgi:hypothetical protein